MAAEQLAVPQPNRHAHVAATANHDERASRNCTAHEGSWAEGFALQMTCAGFLCKSRSDQGPDAALVTDVQTLLLFSAGLQIVGGFLREMTLVRNEASAFQRFAAAKQYTSWQLPLASDTVRYQALQQISVQRYYVCSFHSGRSVVSSRHMQPAFSFL